MLPDTIRAKELELLLQWVAERKQILLVGAPGSGKGHLLDKLQQRLQGRRLCLVFKLSFLSSWAAFLHTFSTELNLAAKENGTLYLHLKRFLELQPYPMQANADTVIKWMERFSLSLEQTGVDFLFVFEGVELQGFMEEELHSLFGSLMAGRTVQVLCALSKPIAIPNVEVFTLAPIGVDQVSDNPSEKQTQLVELAKGNLQFIRDLWQHDEAELEANEVLQRTLKHYQRHFLLMRNRFTEMQWKLLKAIALEEIVPQPHAFDFLVKYMLGAASSVERALANLVATDFVQKTNEGYVLTDPYMLRWMQWVYSNEKVEG